MGKIADKYSDSILTDDNQGMKIHQNQKDIKKGINKIQELPNRKSNS